MNYFTPQIIGFFVFLLFIFRKNKTENTTLENTTLTEDQAYLISEKALEFMKGPGTDSKPLKELLLPLNNASFNHVSKVFGKKLYRHLFGSDELLTLPQWLIEELRQSQIEPYKEKFTLIKEELQKK